MANRYWVGGSATWDNTAGTKWALTDGGAGGEAVPLSTDDVFFTAGIGAVTVTLGGGMPCQNLNFTGFTGTIVGNNQGITLYGSLTMVSGMTTSGLFSLAWQGSGAGLTLTSAGKLSSVTRITFNFTGDITLQDNLDIGSGQFILSKGTVNANNKNVTIGYFQSAFNTSDARTLNMGSGTWEVNSYNDNYLTGACWYVASANAFTCNPDTATIKIVSNSSVNKVFAGYAKTYPNIWIANQGTETFTIVNSNSFFDFKVDAGRVVKFTDGTTTTITSLDADGTETATTHLLSTGASTFTISAGVLSIEYAAIKNCVKSGGTSTASKSADLGGNTGWTFNPSVVFYMARAYAVNLSGTAYGEPYAVITNYGDAAAQAGFLFNMI